MRTRKTPAAGYRGSVASWILWTRWFSPLPCRSCYGSSRILRPRPRHVKSRSSPEIRDRCHVPGKIHLPFVSCPSHFVPGHPEWLHGDFELRIFTIRAIVFTAGLPIVILMSVPGIMASTGTMYPPATSTLGPITGCFLDKTGGRWSGPFARQSPVDLFDQSYAARDQRIALTASASHRGEKTGNVDQSKSLDVHNVAG